MSESTSRKGERPSRRRPGSAAAVAGRGEPADAARRGEANGAERSETGRDALPRKKAARGKLSRDGIELAALELIEEAGLNAFSTRKLAQKLGCEAMSIYHHFPSVAHLYEALVDRLVAPLSLLPASDPWQARLLHAAGTFRAIAHAHPHFFPYVALFRMNTPICIAWLDGTIQIFRDAGLGDADAARYFRSFSYYLVGALLDETSGYAAGPGAVEPVSGEVIRRDFPAVAAVGPYFQPSFFDRTYETGLHHLMAGIEQAVAEAGTARRDAVGPGAEPTPPSSR